MTAPAISAPAVKGRLGNGQLRRQVAEWLCARPGPHAVGEVAKDLGRSAAASTTSGTRRSRCGSTPGCPPPRSPAAPGTASRSCSRSTPTASTGRPMQPTSASPTPSAARATGKTPVKRVTQTASRPSEVAGQRRESGLDGQRNRSHQPRPWPFRPPSVAFTAPKSGSHGRIADHGGPNFCLEAHMRWSTGGDSGGASGL
jgi:hypothetical protein